MKSKIFGAYTETFLFQLTCVAADFIENFHNDAYSDEKKKKGLGKIFSGRKNCDKIYTIVQSHMKYETPSSVL